MGTLDKSDQFHGLDDEFAMEAESVSFPEGQQPIDLLKPDSDAHDKVLRYLMKRLKHSEQEMQVFYSRWRTNEIKVQAYINLANWEQILKEMNDSGKAPKVVSVIIPYSMAIISTIVTYQLQTFTGQMPIFQVGTYQDDVSRARNMETLLEYNANHARYIKHLFYQLQDAQIYGVGILRSAWKREMAWRTRKKSTPLMNLFGVALGKKAIQAEKEKALVYEGNEVFSVDPFMFFPDPSVPMSEVNRKGEFVFWRTFEGRHTLLRAQADGDFKWVKYAGNSTQERLKSSLDSARSLLSGGRPTPGINSGRWGQTGSADYIQVDQGTCDIIPKDLGLGDSEDVERWIFTILNKKQIVQAEPFDADHGLHPVSVCEPYSLGYGFGQPGGADYLGPMQDTIGWLFNSHIDNVRKVLNDIVVVDPMAIEMQDLKNPEPGKILRLKRSAIGRDVRSVIQQLPVADVTQGNVADAQLMIRIGQMLSGVSDNLLGIQQAGGRKTATEVRTAAEAGGSRLAAQSRIISAQSGVDLTMMWSVNTQQYLSDEFYLRVTGRDGAEDMLITPDMLSGDFHYPIHDGTLPMDKVALLDVWKEIFQAAVQVPQIQSEYSIPKMFEFMANLAGAKNIGEMRLGVASDQTVQAQAQAGNIAPAGGPSGVVNAMPQNPRSRLMGVK